MGTPSYTILPNTQNILATMGDQIKKARLRRGFSVGSISKQVGISRTTLWSVEKGSPSVAIGIYAAVLHTLDNMDRDLLLIAKEDAIGRELQDRKLPVRKRAPRKED